MEVSELAKKLGIALMAVAMTAVVVYMSTSPPDEHAPSELGHSPSDNHPSSSGDEGPTGPESAKPDGEAQVRYLEEAIDVIAVQKWRESLGYLDSPLNTSSIASTYEAYDDETLESLANLGDANAQLLLAERYSIVEEKQDRLLELYFEAAIAGKTAGLTALGTYGFTDKIFGKNDLVRVDEKGQLTEEYEKYLAFFLAAELQQDPVGAALFDFNVRDEHKSLVLSRMNTLCKQGESIVDSIEQLREERGMSVEVSRPPQGLFDEASPNWHCRQGGANS